MSNFYLFTKLTLFSFLLSLSFSTTVQAQWNTVHGFENGWGIWNDGGSDCSRYNDTNAGLPGSYCAQIRDNSGHASSIFTKVLNLSGHSAINVDFKYFAKSMEFGEDFFLEYSNDGGHVFQKLKTFVSGVDFHNGSVKSEKLHFKRNFGANCVFRFRCDASSNYDQVYLDEIRIWEDSTSPCGPQVTFHNNGTCGVNLHHWLPTGDVFMKTIGVGQSHVFSAILGHKYRIVNLNHDWSNLLYDHSMTATADCEQVWNMAPDYCVPTSNCSYEQYDYSQFESNWGIWKNGQNCTRYHNTGSTGLFSHLFGWLDGFLFGQSSNHCLEVQNRGHFLTNILNLHGVKGTKFDFDIMTDGCSYNDEFALEYSLDGGNSWLFHKKWSYGTHFQNKKSTKISTIIDAVFSAKSLFRLKHNGYSYGRKLYFDNIKMERCGTVAPTTEEVTVYNNGTCDINVYGPNNQHMGHVAAGGFYKFGGLLGAKYRLVDGLTSLLFDHSITLGTNKVWNVSPDYCMTGNGCDYTTHDYQQFGSGWGIWNPINTNCSRYNYTHGGGLLSGLFGFIKTAKNFLFGGTSNQCIQVNNGINSGIISSVLDLGGITSTLFDFDYMAEGYRTGDEIMLEYSLDGGSSWLFHKKWKHGSHFINGSLGSFSTVISRLFTNNTLFRIKGLGNNNCKLYLDNIRIKRCGTVAPTTEEVTVYNNGTCDINVYGPNNQHMGHVAAGGFYKFGGLLGAKYRLVDGLTSLLFDHSITLGTNKVWNVSPDYCMTGSGCDYTTHDYQQFGSGWGIWNPINTNCSRYNYTHGGGLLSGLFGFIKTAKNFLFGGTSNQCIQVNNSINSGIISSVLDLGGITSTLFDFDYMAEGYRTGDEIMLEYSLDGGSSWLFHKKWKHGSHFINGSLGSFSTVISRLFTNNTLFRIKGLGNNNCKLYLDNIRIKRCGTVAPTTEEVTVYNNGTCDINVYGPNNQHMGHVAAGGFYKFGGLLGAKYRLVDGLTSLLFDHSITLGTNKVWNVSPDYCMTGSGCDYTTHDYQQFGSGWGIWNPINTNCSRYNYTHGGGLLSGLFGFIKTAKNFLFGGTSNQCIQVNNGINSGIISSVLDLGGITSTLFDFDYMAEGYRTGDEIMLEYSLDGGSSWLFHKKWKHGSHFINGSLGSFSTVISKLFTNNTLFRIKGLGNNNCKLYLDNVRIKRCGNVVTGGNCIEDHMNYQGFETNWGIWNDGGGDCSRNYEPGTAAAGNYCVRLRDNSGSASSIISKIFDFSRVMDCKIDFMYLPKSMESGEDFMLEYSNDGGSTYQLVKRWVSGIDFSNNQKKSESVTFSGNFTNNTKLRFRCDASSNYDQVYLDEVNVYVCKTPNFGTGDQVFRAVTTETSTEGFTAGFESIETEETNEDTFVIDLETTIESSEAPAALKIYPNPVSMMLNIDGLTEGVSYEVYNFSGQKVISNSTNKELSVTELENGGYILRTNTGETMRFIKI